MVALKPTVRYDIQAAIIEPVLDILKKERAYISCLSCFHFNENSELCKLAKKRPPARIIVYGCEEWIEKDEIPF